MPRHKNVLGAHATTAIVRDDVLVVTYHQTEVVTADFKSKAVILDNGGFQTDTTKRRMNEAARQFDLGYEVKQADGQWYAYVRDDGRCIDFDENGICSFFRKEDV